MKSADPLTARAARLSNDYRQAKNHEAWIEAKLAQPVTEKGKLNFDSFEERNGVLNVAALDPQGLSKVRLEKLLLMENQTQSFDVGVLSGAYARRFGTPENIAHAFTASEFSVTQDNLRKMIAAKPSEAGCQALSDAYLKSPGSLGSEENLLPIIRARSLKICK
jgi:hypothetical protein